MFGTGFHIFINLRASRRSIASRCRIVPRRPIRRRAMQRERKPAENAVHSAALIRRRGADGCELRRNAGKLGRHILDDPEPARWSCGTGRRRGERRSATGPAGSRRSPRLRVASAGSAIAAHRPCQGAGRPAAARRRPSRPRPAERALQWPSARARPMHGPAKQAGRAKELSHAPRTGINRASSDGDSHAAEQSRLRGSVDMESMSPTFLPALANATARLAATVDLPTPPLPLPMAISLRLGSATVSATLASLTPGIASVADRSAFSKALRSASARPVASAMIIATPPFSRRERMRSALGSRSSSVSTSLAITGAHRCSSRPCHCFSVRAVPILAA